MAASGGRYRLAWFETLLDDCQLLLGCPPPTANITRQQFNMSILVRHKPVLKSVLEPFCLCRLSGRNGGQFISLCVAAVVTQAKEEDLSGSGCAALIARGEGSRKRPSRRLRRWPYPMQNLKQDHKILFLPLRH